MLGRVFSVVAAAGTRPSLVHALKGARAVSDVGRVLWAVPGVERARREEGPKAAVAAARRRGLRRPASTLSRRHLQSLIRMVDRLLPGGPNCFRRVLLEMTFDRDAASSPVRFGLRSGLARRSGHAWLSGSAEAAAERFDVEIAL
jgi:hypothetical protein